MNEFERLAAALSPLGLPVVVGRYRQTEGRHLPDAYVVLAHITAREESHYSSAAWRINALYSVTLYTRNHGQAEEMAQRIRLAVKQAGFFYVRSGPDIIHETGHLGRTLDVRWYRPGK